MSVCGQTWRLRRMPLTPRTVSMVGAIPRLMVVRLSRNVMTMAMHTKHIMLDHVDQIVEYCGVWRGPQERVSVTIRRGTADSATGHPDVSHS